MAYLAEGDDLNEGLARWHAQIKDLSHPVRKNVVGPGREVFNGNLAGLSYLTFLKFCCRLAGKEDGTGEFTFVAWRQTSWPVAVRMIAVDLREFLLSAEIAERGLDRFRFAFNQMVKLNL